MDEAIFVSREELYEQVWTTPTRHLAAKYGISDVAIRKICKKLFVPKPPPGYWARVRRVASPGRLHFRGRGREVQKLDSTT